MQQSFGWEAIYTEKPNFSADFDYCLFENNKLIGILAGHKIKTQNNNIYSAEILALDASYHKKGLTPSLLISLFESIPKQSLIQFWTKDSLIKSYYEKSLKLPCIQSLKHFKNKMNQEEFWATKETDYHQASIWCFACTEKQIQTLKPSTQYEIELD